MSLGAAAATSLAELALIGLVPTVALLGLRLAAVPLAPVVGAVTCALGASASLAVGGPLLLWTTGLGLVAGGASALWWWRSPDRRPWRRRAPSVDAGERALLAIGALGALAAAAWSLRGLGTETIGFDTRALWALRSGWMLHDHAQMLLDFKIRQFLIGQSGYPPLVSAEAAFAWGATGLRSARLEVVLVALLDLCGLLALAAGLLAAGRAAGEQLVGRARLLPIGAGAVAAIAIVPIGAGLAEPFLTNGYADPMWAICAAGALVFGLLLPIRPQWQAAAGVLVVGAGMSKQEGMFTAICIVGLVLLRQICSERDRSARRRRAARAGTAALLELGAMAAWPLAIAATGSRQVSSPLSPPSDWPHRAHAVLTGFSPSLHVLVLALAVSAVGWAALWKVRRRAGLGADPWSWAGLVAGLGVVGGVLTTGSAAVGPWIEGSVHRVTQYPALAGWTIVAAWAIVAAAGLAGTADEGPRAGPPA